MSIKPNFLIVGAAKSGTTSLYEYLKQHPDVFMPHWKEPSFFVKGIGIERLEEYEELFRGAAGRKAVGEASVAYLYDTEAAGNILNYLGPSVRIVIILRNPIDMAYSLWGHMVRTGVERLSFFDALKAENDRMAGESFKRGISSWLYNFAYADRAKYRGQVERYLDKFHKARVGIYIFEEFFGNNNLYFRDLCGFLSISDDFTPEFRAYNIASGIRSSLIAHVVNNKSSLKEAIKLIVPPGIRQVAKKCINRVNRENVPLPPLSADDRRKLWGLFEEDVNQLETLIGRNLSAIWEPRNKRRLMPVRGQGIRCRKLMEEEANV